MCGPTSPMALNWQGSLTESFLDGGLVVFDIIGEINDIETIAIGGGIRDIIRLQKQYGPGRWRKLKGVARVRLHHGSVRRAEVHWYEARCIGRKKMKIKRFLD
jgi:hypothetical protein